MSPSITMLWGGSQLIITGYASVGGGQAQPWAASHTHRYAPKTAPVIYHIDHETADKVFSLTLHFQHWQTMPDDGPAPPVGSEDEAALAFLVSEAGKPLLTAAFAAQPPNAADAPPATPPGYYRVTRHAVDQNQNFVPDWVELAAGNYSPLAGPNDPDFMWPGDDADGDGESNAMEAAGGTDPNDPDTDKDGLPDGHEKASGQNPLIPDVSEVSKLVVMQSGTKKLKKRNEDNECELKDTWEHKQVITVDVAEDMEVDIGKVEVFEEKPGGSNPPGGGSGSTPSVIVDWNSKRPEPPDTEGYEWTYKSQIYVVFGREASAAHLIPRASATANCELVWGSVASDANPGKSLLFRRKLNSNLSQAEEWKNEMPGAYGPTAYIGTVPPVIFDIHDGQAASAPVEAGKKLTRGAFTVANKNNTDNDKKPNTTPEEDYRDFEDNDVPGEVDLMQLRIKGFKGQKGSALLSVPTNVKVWKHAAKGQEAVKETVPPGEKAKYTFDIGTDGVDQTVWVEALEPSAAVRDLLIVLEHKIPGEIPGEFELKETDSVRATAVWVEKTNFVHKFGQKIPDDFDAAISQFWKSTPPKLVPGIFFTNSGPHGGMIMEFTLAPAGIEKETAVRFDIARSVASKTRIWNTAVTPPQSRPLHSKAFLQGDVANDDAVTTDEDIDPTKLHIYDTDVPGVVFEQGGLLPLPSEVLEDVANFYEWTRVRCDGTRPDNAGPGTRCSAKEKWHYQLKCGFQSTPNGQRAWQLDPNFKNEVDTGHVPLPQ